MDFQYTTAVFFNLFIGMRPLLAFRLLAEPHALSQGFVLGYCMWTETSLSYTIIMHEKNGCLIHL